MPVKILKVGGGGGGGGINVAESAVVWNPGAAPDPTLYVTTWDEVMTAFSTVTGDFRVFLDTSGGGAFSIPANTYDLDSRVSLARTAPAVGQVTVVMADGALLQNPAGLYRNITLQANNTTDPAIELSDGRGMELDLGCILENAGSVPMIAVATGDTISLGFYRSSSIDASGDVLVDIDVNGTLEATFQGNSQSYTDWATGDATATLAINYDATYIATGLSAAPGTVTETATTLIEASSEGLFVSVVDYIVGLQSNDPSLLGMVNADRTTGCRIAVLKPTTITGIRFAWGDALVPKTIRCSIWKAAVRVASVDVAAPAPGIFSGYFAAPYTCIPDTTTNWYYSIWDTSGAKSCYFATPVEFPMSVTSGALGPYQMSPGLVAQIPHLAYGAGDNAPTLQSATPYPVEPLFR